MTTTIDGAPTRRRGKITALELRQLAEGRFLADPAVDGGALEARRLASGRVALYARITAPDGRRERVALGPWSERGGEGLKLDEARREVGRLRIERAAAHALGLTVRERIDAEREAERRAFEEARKAAEVAEGQTLAALLNAYVAWLEAQGKPSAADTKDRVRRHILQPFPELCARPAADIRRSDLLPVMARLIDRGQERSAGLVRSHLSAALEAAIRAPGDARAPAALRAFDLEVNPARALRAIPTTARDRALSEAEAREYLKRVEALPHGPTRTALLLALLMGGQRMTQLLNVHAVDVDLEGRTATLRDTKGRRQRARLHTLPLTDRTLELWKPLLDAQGDGGLLFTSDGHRRTRLETVGAAALAIARDMEAAGTARAPFSLGDIRRTCETRLAALGVTGDVRAQLQSHGLAGVQARHYDRHDYLNEKLQALSLWQGFLYGPSGAKVVRLPRVKA